MNRNCDGIIVIAEDQRLRAVAVGFFSNNLDMSQNIYIDKYQKGWPKVKDRIPKCNATLKQYPKLRIVLIIDFDGKKNRYDYFMKDVDQDVKDRLFILGPLHNVEQLKKCCNAPTFEQLGHLLREDCLNKDSAFNIWNCPELSDFKEEIKRICENVKDFLWTREFLL